MEKTNPYSYLDKANNNYGNNIHTKNINNMSMNVLPPSIMNNNPSSTFNSMKYINIDKNKPSSKFNL